MTIFGEPRGRIALKILVPDDVTQVYVDWMNDAEITQYLESRWQAHTLESIREFVRTMNASPNDVLFGVFLHEAGTLTEHIGNIKIGNIHRLHSRAELGLIIGSKTHWGKGYATEAIRLATRYGFEELNLNKLFAGMYADNVGSYNAFIKAGYRKVAELQQHCFSHGIYVNELLVERCRHEA
jgi:RimJ/RimL family protein N-acetyltransferase